MERTEDQATIDRHTLVFEYLMCTGYAFHRVSEIPAWAIQNASEYATQKMRSSFRVIEGGKGRE